MLFSFSDDPNVFSSTSIHQVHLLQPQSTTMTEKTISKKKKKGFMAAIKHYCETCGEGYVSLDALRYHRAAVHDPFIIIKGHKGTLIIL
jgi:hypothetical protein